MLHSNTYPYVFASLAPRAYNRKNILITGASRRRWLCYCTVRSFALSAASNIAIIARNYSTLSTVTAKLRALSPPLNVLPFSFGVTSAAVVNAAMEEVVKRFETIDVLVNNTAVFEPYVKIADSDQIIW